MDVTGVTFFMLDFRTPYALPNFVMFVALFVRPAYQTYVSLESGKWRGRWAQYWIGICFLTTLFLIVKPFIETIPIVWVVEIFCAFGLAYDRGVAVRSFAISVVVPLYMNTRDIIHSAAAACAQLPNMIVRLIVE